MCSSGLSRLFSKCSPGGISLLGLPRPVFLTDCYPSSAAGESRQNPAPFQARTAEGVGVWPQWQSSGESHVQQQQPAQPEVFPVSQLTSHEKQSREGVEGLCKKSSTYDHLFSTGSKSKWPQKTLQWSHTHTHTPESPRPQFKHYDNQFIVLPSCDHDCDLLAGFA